MTKQEFLKKHSITRISIRTKLKEIRDKYTKLSI